MNVADLPHLNAALNAAAAIALTIGYGFIRRGRVQQHLACMLAGFGASIAFLISYLIYHFDVGSVPYTGSGWLRAVYYPILASHVVLAALVPPLALVTIYRAARRRFDRHRAIARWTLPVWLYVSVTGIVVYLLLYRVG
ncbi:MAG TPA: DUF420 domain-containing protein [Longimicrobiales bacterium]|nr:DUF420 domain-containing protein [Longimicrobiales bacterium]